MSTISELRFRYVARNFRGCGRSVEIDLLHVACSQAKREVYSNSGEETAV